MNENSKKEAFRSEGSVSVRRYRSEPDEAGIGFAHIRAISVAKTLGLARDVAKLPPLMSGFRERSEQATPIGVMA